jgi:hypothetical protein
VTQDSEGLRALVFANPTGILLTGDIKDPLERVLDAPVLPYRLGEPHALRWEGHEKIPRLDPTWNVNQAVERRTPHVYPGIRSSSTWAPV